MNILVIDVGGTNVKIWRSPDEGNARFPSGKELTPMRLVEIVKDLVDGRGYDRVSLGYPGEVQHGRPHKEPYNLAPGWITYDFDDAFGAPVRVMNDACMQALGSYEGGKMLYLGLGTSLGTVFISSGHIVPLALGHLSAGGNASFDDLLNRKALDDKGPKRWEQTVHRAAEQLKAAFLADYVTLGGGNVKHLKTLPDGCRRGGNHNAYFGGLKMWDSELANLIDKQILRNDAHVV